jgi:hypothetical protein
LNPRADGASRNQGGLTELRATDETVDKALTVSEKHLKNLQQHPGYVSLAADGIHGRRRRR